MDFRWCQGAPATLLSPAAPLPPPCLSTPRPAQALRRKAGEYKRGAEEFRTRFAKECANLGIQGKEVKPLPPDSARPGQLDRPGVLRSSRGRARECTRIVAKELLQRSECLPSLDLYLDPLPLFERSLCRPSVYF